MTTRAREVTILGMHPVEPSEELLAETLEVQWGSALSGAELLRARGEVKAHFESLYLIEVQVHPATARIEWLDFTQVEADQPRANWQVPLDEQAVDAASGRWAFFFHVLDPARPLETPAGPRALPPASARPVHLSHFGYELP